MLMWLHNMRDPDLSEQSDFFPIHIYFFAKLLASSTAAQIEFYWIWEKNENWITASHMTNAEFVHSVIGVVNHDIP